jgi:pentose-5-phosphate-3-epimerase/putative flippase GtrA
MRQILNAELFRLLAFGAYRYRFLAVYIIIGVISLTVEVLLYRGLERLGLTYPYCAWAGVLGGILFAFWGNVRFNFKVPQKKRRRALLYFVVIAIFSWALQYLLRGWISDWGWSYEQARFVISGVVFLAAYALHRRFSFSDYKKLGVAVYANGIEDIRGIRQRIENYPDIIHVDIVDSTFGREDHEVRTYRLEVVRAYWPDKPVHVHIMSRVPSQYLRDLYPHVDRIYVHAEASEDVEQMLKDIRLAGKQPGLAVCLSTELEAVKPYLPLVDGVLFLAIPNAGHSGQPFQMPALERIAEFNSWPGRSRLDVCVDGGVTERNVGLLNVEIVVSGSSVLNNPEPRRQIMRLQTSSSYEQT